MTEPQAGTPGTDKPASPSILTLLSAADRADLPFPEGDAPVVAQVTFACSEAGEISISFSPSFDDEADLPEVDELVSQMALRTFLGNGDTYIASFTSDGNVTFSKNGDALQAPITDVFVQHLVSVLDLDSDGIWAGIVGLVRTLESARRELAAITVEFLSGYIASTVVSGDRPSFGGFITVIFGGRRSGPTLADLRPGFIRIVERPEKKVERCSCDTHDNEVNVPGAVFLDAPHGVFPEFLEPMVRRVLFRVGGRIAPDVERRLAEMNVRAIVERTLGETKEALALADAFGIERHPALVALEPLFTAAPPAEEQRESVEVPPAS